MNFSFQIPQDEKYCPTPCKFIWIRNLCYAFVPPPVLRNEDLILVHAVHCPGLKSRIYSASRTNKLLATVVPEMESNTADTTLSEKINLRRKRNLAGSWLENLLQAKLPRNYFLTI